MKRRRMSWLAAQFARRPRPAWILIISDLLVFAVALNVFALFHHVLPQHEDSVGITSQRAVQAQAPAEAAQESLLPQEPADAQGVEEPQAVQEEPEGSFGIKFADKFTSGEVERTETSYRSANISLEITTYRHNEVDFYVADFYLRDVASFQTGFAKDTFARGQYESVEDTLARMNAIMGINGDYYGGRRDGIVARNGTLYRDDDNPKRDICVLYWDGRLETYSPKGFDAEAEMARGAYQIWNFGPQLLDQNGQSMQEFNSDVNPRNPRTAIGYFEPGHYCFVAVDGRSKQSAGITLKNLSLLMYNLGCVRAYNLDGGETSKMVYGTTVVNVPAGNGRMSTDVIGIVEP